MNEAILFALAMVALAYYLGFNRVSIVTDIDLRSVLPSYLSLAPAAKVALKWM